MTITKQPGKPSGDLTRRKFVSLIAGVPLVSLPDVAFGAGDDNFPAKAEFDIKGTYMNAAFTHPMSKGSFNEVRNFLNDRMVNRSMSGDYDAHERTSVKANFAKLINALPEEIAWVSSTMVGENLVVSGLSLPGTSARIVTDAFHFNGSLHYYNQLAKQGMDVYVVRPRNNRIDLNDLDKAINPGTRLLAISLVSATTGYQHDLKRICELTHARGAMVYADIIQAAGAVPIDVKDSGVDFCACATYKWLMGDFGVGFLYVRKDRLEQLKRTLIGYRQISKSTSHFLPFDEPGEIVFESESKEDMSGHFEVGTFASSAIAALRYSLPYLNRVGVSRIQEYRKPLIRRLQDMLPAAGFIPLTPVESTSPIVSFAFKNADKVLTPRLSQADINIQVYENMIRISPSFYNDLADIEKLLEVLKPR